MTLLQAKNLITIILRLLAVCLFGVSAGYLGVQLIVMIGQGAVQVFPVLPVVGFLVSIGLFFMARPTVNLCSHDLADDVPQAPAPSPVG